MVLGAIVGTGYALSRGNEYTAQARVAVSGVGLNPNNIPGFSNAAPELAADYARYVDTSDNAPILITALGANAASKVHSITASPIPQSTVIAIEVTASTSDVAIRATNAIASNLVKQVAQTQQATSPETTLEQYQKMTTQLAAAQTDVTKAQNELTAQQNAH
ncbi:MAG TPA: hypothetical protein VHC41_08620, partial [Mycobacteriales bacterium]|nr:hypothetical protein [Mycobacteriales bacterium]